MLRCATIVLLLCCAACSTLPHGQQVADFPAADPAQLNAAYLRYIPPGATRRDRLPLLLFLHGSGERGDDIQLVAKHGPPKHLAAGEDLPFVVISPQLPAGARWHPGSLSELLDHVERTLPVDPERIYVTGLSLGGHGTWALGAADPGRFAAVLPVCGRGDPADACRFRELPAWALHGEDDDIVPVSGSTDMVAAIRACGGDARLTVYSDTGHDAWTPTYSDPAVYEWLLAHRRIKAKPAAAASGARESSAGVAPARPASSPLQSKR